MYPGSPLDTPADDLREEEDALDDLRERAYGGYRARGARSLGDLDLRAAAQHAQVVGDGAAEREIDGVLEVREAGR